MDAIPEPSPAASPALAVGLRHAVLLSADGEVAELTLHAAAYKARRTRLIVCHLPAVARRLGCAAFPACDVLELFAFVHPARFCLPTPRGVAEALGLKLPGDLEQDAETLMAAADLLLRQLTAQREREVVGLAWAMARGNWSWSGPVLQALGVADEAPHAHNLAESLRVWKRLAEISEHAPEPPPGNLPVEAAETRAHLAQLLGPGAESRPQQGDYASAVSAAFLPRDEAGAPRVVLAEAGTGIGKTMGYIAPASLWASRNNGPVWLSTYTRNLQRQIDAELDRLYPDPAEKARKVVVRKGRENYLCLLNLEEAVQTLPNRPGDAVALGLMARWASRSRDGDMVGGDFPGWLADLVGRPSTVGLTDRRGECIHSACEHYHKCFIERAVRRAKRAEIVVANHALVMIQAALGGLDDESLPRRYVFDEGHHVFDAADNAFAAQLSGLEAAELRRWLLGAEDGRSRARGLKRRIGDLTGGKLAAERALEDALHAARALPGSGWHQRLAEDQPFGPCEAFLAMVRRQVLARAPAGHGHYGLETDIRPPIEGLAEVAAALEVALERLHKPLAALGRVLAAQLGDEAAELDTTTRQRIESACRSLKQRGESTLATWQAMLRTLREEDCPGFVDWFALERSEGREIDVGMHRHWTDPTFPFAEAVAARAQGIVITSATLTDGTGDAEADWRAAEARTGAGHLPDPPLRAKMLSPFDYKAQTRVLVVGDVRKDDMDQVAAAYRELFLAAGGGGLGLFTAINRLRAVHHRIAPALDAAGLQLLAQHVDPLDTSTLVDIFRAEHDSCLLGTDAVRDGVDVPGRSLRLIVFDRVPWPRATILHRARRAAAPMRGYEDMLTRLRLKQAFGRLVRRADDCGVFVMLDRALPSRLGGAFPEGVEVQRVGLKDAIDITRLFLHKT